MSDSLPLHRKYRPRRFREAVGQESTADVLRTQVAQGRVAQGYLLEGARGIGKTTLARVLAMALNCAAQADGEPCGACPSCLSISRGQETLDVVEMDAASNRGVDDAQRLRERALYAPSDTGRYKVYIVDEAHMLTREAWNALLKVLEEPPPRVVFVFATTEAKKIEQTSAAILSRVQRFTLRTPSVDEIAQNLARVCAAEEITAETDALYAIAQHADGAHRDALVCLDQVRIMGDVTVARVEEVIGHADQQLVARVAQVAVNGRTDDVAALLRDLRRSSSPPDYGQLFRDTAVNILNATLAASPGGGDVAVIVDPGLVDLVRTAGSTRAFNALDALQRYETRVAGARHPELAFAASLYLVAAQAARAEDVWTATRVRPQAAGASEPTAGSRPAVAGVGA